MAPDTGLSASDDSVWKRSQAFRQSEILGVVDRAIDDHATVLSANARLQGRRKGRRRLPPGSPWRLLGIIFEGRDSAKREMWSAQSGPAGSTDHAVCRRRARSALRWATPAAQRSPVPARSSGSRRRRSPRAPALREKISFAAIAPGSAMPIVAKPLEMTQVFVPRHGNIRAIQILCAPTSEMNDIIGRERRPELPDQVLRPGATRFAGALASNPSRIACAARLAHGDQRAPDLCRDLLQANAILAQTPTSTM